MSVALSERISRFKEFLSDHIFENEPVDPDNPLLKLDNVILTPHTAALTRECVIRMATEAAQCVIHVLDGKIPRNVANPQILKSEKWKHLRS